MASTMLLLFVLITRLASHAFAAALPVQDAGLGNVTWSGNITEGGPIVKLTGTSLHDIERQISSTVDGFAWKDTPATQSLNVTEHAAVRRSMNTPRCGITAGHRPCSHDAISDGSRYLMGIEGKCHVEARTCTRVSCSENSGIYFCNDNQHEIWVPCIWLGMYAQYINSECPLEHGMGVILGTAGQLFDADGWNVFVGATTAEEGRC